MESNVTKQILTLYVKKHESMQQVATRLQLSVGLVRRVLQKNRIARRSRGEAIRYLHITKHHKKAFVVKKDLTKSEEKLKVAGVMLYWGEGTKSGTTVTLSNSNPLIILLFLKFLRIVCGIDERRLRLTLHAYPDHDLSELKKFWSKATKIPLDQFHAPHIHFGKKGTYQQKSQYGTVAVRYSDIALLETITRWMVEYSQTL